MIRVYNASMPINEYDDNKLRLSVYGLAYEELKIKYPEYVVFSIREDLYSSTKTETRTFAITIELLERDKIN